MTPSVPSGCGYYFRTTYPNHVATAFLPKQQNLRGAGIRGGLLRAHLLRVHWVPMSISLPDYQVLLSHTTQKVLRLGRLGQFHLK